jgi:AcrR family transcriptional regulator
MDVSHKPLYRRDPKIVAERILDAAEAEFVAQGFTGASTNRVMAQFGGSKATLFRYYPTKAELFVAVMRRIGKRLVAEVDWAALDGDDPQAWLTDFARMALRASLREDALFVGRMVVAHGREFPALRETFVVVAIEPVVTALADFLRASTQKGLLNCEDADADAVRFFDLVATGWTSRALFGIGPERDEAFFIEESARATALFLDGRRRA